MLHRTANALAGPSCVRYPHRILASSFHASTEQWLQSTPRSSAQPEFSMTGRSTTLVQPDRRNRDKTHSLSRGKYDASLTARPSHVSPETSIALRRRGNTTTEIVNPIVAEDIEAAALQIPVNLSYRDRLRLAYRALHHPKGKKRYEAKQDSYLAEATTHPNPPTELMDVKRMANDNSHLVQVGISAMRLQGWMHARRTGIGLSIDDMQASVDALVSTPNLHGIAMRLQWPRIIYQRAAAQLASIRLMARTTGAMMGVVQVDRKWVSIERTLERQLAIVPIRGDRAFDPIPDGREPDSVEFAQSPLTLPADLTQSPLVPADVPPLTLGERVQMVRTVTYNHFTESAMVQVFIEAITHSSKRPVTPRLDAPIDNKVLARLGDAAMRAILWEWMYLFHRDVPVNVLAEEIEYRLRDEVLLELAEDMYWRQCLYLGNSLRPPTITDRELAITFTRAIMGAIMVSREYERLASTMRMTGLLSDELRSPRGREAQAAIAAKGLPQGPNQRPRPASANFRWKPLSMQRSPGTEPVVVDYLDYGAASGHDQILAPIIGSLAPTNEDLLPSTESNPESSEEDQATVAALESQFGGQDFDQELAKEHLAHFEKDQREVRGLQRAQGHYVKRSEAKATYEAEMETINSRLSKRWMGKKNQVAIQQTLEWAAARKATGQWASGMRTGASTARGLGRSSGSDKERREVEKQGVGEEQILFGGESGGGVHSGDRGTGRSTKERANKGTDV